MCVHTHTHSFFPFFSGNPYAQQRFPTGYGSGQDRSFQTPPLLLPPALRHPAPEISHCDQKSPKGRALEEDSRPQERAALGADPQESGVAEPSRRWPSAPETWEGAAPTLGGDRALEASSSFSQREMLQTPEDLGVIGASERAGAWLGPACLWAEAQAPREQCAGTRGQQGHRPAAVPETPEGPWAQAAARLSAVWQALV